LVRLIDLKMHTKQQMDLTEAMRLVRLEMEKIGLTLLWEILTSLSSKPEAARK